MVAGSALVASITTFHSISDGFPATFHLPSTVTKANNASTQYISLYLNLSEHYSRRNCLLDTLRLTLSYFKVTFYLNRVRYHNGSDVIS